MFLAVVQKIELVEDLNLVLPEQPRPWLLIVLGAIAVLLLLVGLFWWIKSRRAARLAAIPPEKTALEALGELYKSLAELNPNEYALRISQILRVYIEGQFGLRAPHRSTEEFLAEAERSEKLHTREREAVGNFLRRCDRVKFALGDLAVEGKISLHKEAVRFVEETAVEAARRRQAEALATKAAARKAGAAEANDEVATVPKADFSGEYRPVVFTEATMEPPPVIDEVEDPVDLPTLNPREVAGR